MLKQLPLNPCSLWKSAKWCNADRPFHKHILRTVVILQMLPNEENYCTRVHQSIVQSLRMDREITQYSSLFPAKHAIDRTN